MTGIDYSTSLKKLSVATAGLVVASIGVISLWSKEVRASAMTIGCSSPDFCNLQELFDGGTIIIEDKIFDNWTPFQLASNQLVVPDISLINVIPLDDDPFNPGLQFNANGQLSIVDEEFISLDLGFRLASGNGNNRIKDSSLELTSFGFGTDSGSIAIAESVFVGNGSLLGDKFVVADPLFGNFDLSDSVNFAPQSSIFVTTNIGLSGDNSGDTISLNLFEQRFSETVLEPSSTLGLLALGLTFLNKKRN